MLARCACYDQFPDIFFLGATHPLNLFSFCAFTWNDAMTIMMFSDFNVMFSCLFLPDPCQLPHPTCVLLRQTLLRRRTSCRIQTLLACSKAHWRSNLTQGVSPSQNYEQKNCSLKQTNKWLSDYLMQNCVSQLWRRMELLNWQRWRGLVTSSLCTPEHVNTSVSPSCCSAEWYEHG